MKKFLGYRCSICGTEYSENEVTYTCPLDMGNLDVRLDYTLINSNPSKDLILQSKDTSLWRYHPLLPVDLPEAKNSPLYAVGGTPVFSSKRLAEEIGLQDIWIKDESRNPTASFKDRASAIVISRAMEIGAEVVITASTGNAGAALAGMAAAVDQQAVILAPKNAPPAKIAQLLIYGSKVILVDGTYDDAFDLSIKASEEFGWYCRNTGYNPFTAEGKKTAAFEIWEWERTNRFLINSTNNELVVFVSVGDGNIISGIHKGFKDLYTLGWIPYIPRIFGVQSEGSAAISNAYHSGEETIHPVQAQTLADSISVDYPRDGIRAIRAARETGGSYLTVSDQEILSAISDLGRVGIFAEPAGATSYAGVIKAIEKNLINDKYRVMIINTGSGLKDVNAAMKAVKQAPIIEPTIEKLRNLIKK